MELGTNQLQGSGAAVTFGTKVDGNELGGSFTLEVDGALAYSSWWLNGAQVVPLKTDGYLPLTLRLPLPEPRARESKVWREGYRKRV